MPYFDIDTGPLLESLSLARIKDASFNAVFDELQHLASPYQKTLTRRQPASNIPEPGSTVDFHWELFQEDPFSQRKEPGEGEATLIFRISQASLTMPGYEGEYLVKGSFQVEQVIRLPDDGPSTYAILLREKA